MDRVLVLEHVTQRILSIRGQRVMVDSDLAQLYGVPTKVFNQAIKRNSERFPKDFMFRLTAEEYEGLAIRQEMGHLRSQIVTSNDKRGGRRYLPLVFTEHGALMAASVLNSRRAIEVSVYVVRAFVRLRNVLANHAKLAKKFEELERRLQGHDAQIIALFDAIRALMAPLVPARRRIGFHGVLSAAR